MASAAHRRVNADRHRLRQVESLFRERDARARYVLGRVLSGLAAEEMFVRS